MLHFHCISINAVKRMHDGCQIWGAFQISQIAWDYWLGLFNVLSHYIVNSYTQLLLQPRTTRYNKFLKFYSLDTLYFTITFYLQAQSMGNHITQSRPGFNGLVFLLDFCGLVDCILNFLIL
jgi:hypothetical protein